jgi:ketosteroid isomerase-like protein
MKSTLIGIFVASLFVVPATAQNLNKIQEAVRSRDQEWARFFDAKDLDKATNAFADDGVLLPQNQPSAVGHEAIRKNLAGLFALPNLKIGWTPVRIVVSKAGDIGYTSGAYNISFTNGGKTVNDKGKYLTVWKAQKDGTWKVAVDMFNTDIFPSHAGGEVASTAGPQ